MERSCGNCAWWKPTRLAAWAAPIAAGRCTFGPAPQCMEGHRTMSANDGRGCLTFVKQSEPRFLPLVEEPAGR